MRYKIISLLMIAKWVFVSCFISLEDIKVLSTYVTLLKVFIMTKQRVTRSTILAGTTSVGMRKLTHDITTKIAVGK